MIRFTVWPKRVQTFFRQFLLISEWHLHIFNFEYQETIRTKILRKLYCARVQTGVEDAKWDYGTFTYPSTFFLPLLFEISSQSFIEYSTVTFRFDPCALLTTGYRKRATTILISACSDITKWLLNWWHFTFLIFIKLNVTCMKIFTSVEYFLYKLYWKRRVCHDSMKSIAMQISTAPPIMTYIVLLSAYEVVDING